MLVMEPLVDRLIGQSRFESLIHTELSAIVLSIIVGILISSGRYRGQVSSQELIDMDLRTVARKIQL